MIQLVKPILNGHTTSIDSNLFVLDNTIICNLFCLRVGLMGPRPDPTMTGRCNLYRSVGSSKIKIRISSWHKAKLALCHDEVRILIFDDPAEQETSQYTEFCSAKLNSTRVLNLVQL